MKTINFGGLQLTVGTVNGQAMATVKKGFFVFSEFGTVEQAAQVGEAFMTAGACCASPRPDCMGAVVPGIGNACKALRGGA